MKTIVTIKGKPVIDIYESFDGSYWFITEKCYKQDSIISGKVYKNDQILFGYARLSACPGFAEFGYISETELKLLGNRVWKVSRMNWPFCPEVEVQETADNAYVESTTDREEPSSRSSKSCSIICKEVDEKMDVIIQQKLDSYLALLDEIKERTKDDETARALLGEVAQDLRSEKIREQTVINGNAPATENQIGYLKRLGAEIPESLTKQQASKLIDTTLAAKKQAMGVIEAPIRIP